MAEADRARWDARYRGRDDRGSSPHPFIVGLDALIPRRGRALDIAGGAGRNALWLARRGLDVTIADISPVGLALARLRAAEQSLNLHVLEIDLEQQPLEAEQFDLILSVCYLWRPLFAEFTRLL